MLPPTAHETIPCKPSWHRQCCACQRLVDSSTWQRSNRCQHSRVKSTEMTCSILDDVAMHQRHSLIMASGGFRREAGRHIGLRHGAKDMTEAPPCGKQPTQSLCCQDPRHWRQRAAWCPGGVGLPGEVPPAGGTHLRGGRLLLPGRHHLRTGAGQQARPPHAPPANCRAALLVPILCEDAVHISACLTISSSVEFCARSDAIGIQRLSRSKQRL